MRRLHKLAGKRRKPKLPRARRVIPSERSERGIGAQCPAQDRAESTKAPAARRPADARALADAVFARSDPVDRACELLNGDDAKGASVKARIWERLVEYAYGRPSQMAEPGSGSDAPMRIELILKVPRPQRARRDAQTRRGATSKRTPPGTADIT